MTADVKMSEIAEVELTHPRIVASSADTVRRCFREISEGGRSEEIYEMKGAGRSIRGIAGELGIARNTVRRYLKSPEAIRAKSRPHQASKLDQYTGYIDRRLHEGLENCVVLHRELRALGYDGGYSILKDYVSPRRRPRQPDATMRFETAPGEQAQVTGAAWPTGISCKPGIRRDFPRAERRTIIIGSGTTTGGSQACTEALPLTWELSLRASCWVTGNVTRRR